MDAKPDRHQIPLLMIILPHFGSRLRRIRRLRGLKQAYIAHLAGVVQTTVSRWEAGEIQPDERVANSILLALSRSSTDDRALRTLVESATIVAHLVTDVDHRLLAASPGRIAEWQRDPVDLLGHSLWRFATEPIVAAETSLDSIGWWENPVPAPVEVVTGTRDEGDLRILPSRMTWERIYLADGTPARLCISVPVTAAP
ncbi:helix-turn-helix transcriptional regulator [Reyranella sp. CPCC 100927]|uniref:helix-turn-helix domain-containing protein n=1 Tax=Reyranella sp. CPCC 100927 TaxID=2599616 RepID=UPI0011B4C7C8|nr:helix-turn-helix transcriptional regulator [Reyranella sp. CPCC 100927]TWT14132.1 helix-turn-helix transcriptional regulator [Reyranella sp. CPCC 100927]